MHEDLPDGRAVQWVFALPGGADAAAREAFIASASWRVDARMRPLREKVDPPQPDAPPSP